MGEGSRKGVYRGEATHCVHCHRKFIFSEFVTVASQKTDEGLVEEKVFCFSDGFGGCMSKYVGCTGIAMRGTDMYFAVERELKNPKPNYKETLFVPFNKFEEDRRKGAVSSFTMTLSRVNKDEN